MKDSYKILPSKLDPFVRVEDYIYINILVKDKLLEQMQQGTKINDLSSITR